MTLTVGSFPYRPVTNPYQRLFTEGIEAAGMDVIRIPPRKWFPVQHAFSTNCDILHFDWPHDWYNGKNAFTRLLKSMMYSQGLQKKTRSKLVWTVHNLIAHDAKDVQFERRMIQKLINRCDGLMVMSESALQNVKEIYQLPRHLSTRVIPHGHFVDCYPNTVGRVDARTDLGISEKEFLVVSVGAVKPYKGIGRLIETFIQQPNPTVRWIIAGAASDESLRVELNGLIAKANSLGNNIEFHDARVEDAKMQVYFNASDAVVLPYDKILNSGSLLLALSFGCPVIAAAKGSIPEVVHPDYAYLFEPDRPETFALAIASARKSFEAAEYEPRTARDTILQFAKQRYGWAEIGLKLKSWYTELLNRPLD